MKLFNWWIDDVRMFDDLPVDICGATFRLSYYKEVGQTAQALCGFPFGDAVCPFLNQFGHGCPNVSRDNCVFVELVYIRLLEIFIPTGILEVGKKMQFFL
jgi:hypothetical protein